MSNKAEEILIELLDKLKDSVHNTDVYIAENEWGGYADDSVHTVRDVNMEHIKWIEERIEVKKTVIIKETK